MTHFLLCVFAYMVGATPFGLLVTRVAGLGDIRHIGSGNIGATNVLRTGNKAAALATLLLDVAKGALVVAFARYYNHGGVFLAAIAVFLGHLYPFWLGFKGGKGVATGFGVFFGACWPVGAVCCGAWLLTAVLFRRSSVAALVAYAISPLVAWHFQSWKTAVLALVIALLVFWRHRANLTRLFAGTEPRIGQKTA